MIGLSNGNIYFECVTLTVTFYLLLNLGHNFLTFTGKRLGVHIWHICSLCPYHSNGTIDFKHVTLTVNFDLLL